MQIKDQNSNKKSNYEFNKIIFKRTKRRGKSQNKQNNCALMYDKNGLVL